MFNVTQLNSQQGRYAIIAEAILPPLFLFLIACYWFRPVDELTLHGKPNGWAMLFVWVLVTAMWCVALVIIGMDTVDELSLIMIGVFSFLGIFGAFMNMLYWYWGSASEGTTTLATNSSSGPMGGNPQSIKIPRPPGNPNLYYRERAIFWMLFSFLCMVGTASITFGSITPSDSKIVAGLFFSLTAAWLGVLTGWFYVGENHRHLGTEEPVK